jgi:Na+/proline symporter
MALTDPLQWVVILAVFLVIIVIVVYFLRTMNKAAKSPTPNLPVVEQGSAKSPVDYTSEGLTGIAYFAIGGTLLLYAFFWITSDSGNNDPIGGLVEYGLAFFALLLIGAGLHGILRSATH